MTTATFPTPSLPSELPTLPSDWRSEQEAYLLLLEEQERRQEQRERAEQAVLAEQSLAAFLRQAWPTIEPATPLEWGWYHDAICDHLTALRTGVIKALYIATPPGTTKSITMNVAFPAWCWTTDPSIRFLCAANSESNATRDSLACRNLILSDWYQERWGHVFKLSSDQNLKTWYTNDKRGHRLTTTTGSKATGKKGDILLLDDAHDVKDVESKVEREGVKYWHDKAFHNRVNSFVTGRRAVIGQRVHYEDLYADLIARGYTSLILPEEFDPARCCTTSIGWSDPRTKEGDWLRESRFGPVQKAEAMKTLGRRGYATQHEQSPGPAEGNHFKREWFANRYFDGPDFYRLPSGKVWFHPEVRWLVVVDPAGGKTASADRTAIGVFGITPENDLLVLHMWAERIGVAEIVPKLLETCNAWRTPTKSIEYVIFEAEFLYNQYAEDAQKTLGMPAVRRQSTEKKDKLTRALPAIIRAEAGQVLFPDAGPSREWVDDCLEEMLAFTGDDDPHDDRVDAIAWAAREAQESEGQVGFEGVFAGSRRAGR